jgi:hypothetical protein
VDLAGVEEGEGLLTAGSGEDVMTFFFQQEPIRDNGRLLIVDEEDSVA